MIYLEKLEEYLDNLLEINNFPRDSSHNGLQVEGNSEVKKIIFGVDASASLFEIAADEDADCIFVHHGLSWGNSFSRLHGITADRLRILFSNGISLYAAHLPLDAHPQIGHNACLANIINLHKRNMFCEYAGENIGVMGELQEISNPEVIADTLQASLQAENFLILGDEQKSIRKIGIVSGGPGVEGIVGAVRNKLDCLVTGEIGHCDYHLIKETGLTVIALGHYCSEKPGVQAVMERLKTQYEIDCMFVDLPTGF
jgi:dinuclear metal center YbgI/SA1388 family protein